MRNLGPACEADLKAVDILVAQDVIDLGVEATFLQMLEGRRKIGRSAKCCNAACLYALYGAVHDIDWRELPEKKKAEFKKLSAELRASGRFR
ncbi:TfoX/Sxy family DNA transformation protein [Stieleria marina]